MRKKHIDPAAGRRLSEIRQYRGISQGELAKALAVKVGTIQGYEHARIDISATRLDQLARGLQCETADLVMPPGAPLPRYLYHQGRRQQRRRSAAQQRQAREGSEPSRDGGDMRRFGIAVALWQPWRSADTDADWITHAGAAEGTP
jgi:transcriptional regulator with XRE-family HTH domain